MSDQQQSTTQAFPSSDQQQSSTQAFVKKTAAQRKLYESGNELAAYAAKQINYHIMGYYPITPSTQIAENLDLSGARGEHNIRLIAAEGEHSAAGICYGASAGGGRVFNATSANGLLYAFLGLFITIIPLVVIGSIARKVYKMNYHSIVGMIAGATTDPPTLAYASTLTEKNVSAVAYSTVYPLAMFLRILSGQFVLLILWQFVS